MVARAILTKTVFYPRLCYARAYQRFDSDSEYIWLLVIQTLVSYNLNLIALETFSRAHIGRRIMDLESEPNLGKRVKNELHRIRQRIDREKNPTKKAKMIKAYRKMSETLI